MTDSVLSPGKGQACSSKAKIFPVIQNKTTQFHSDAAVNLCREDSGARELGSSVSYPEHLVSDAALDSVVVQPGRALQLRHFSPDFLQRCCVSFLWLRKYAISEK